MTTRVLPAGAAALREAAALLRAGEVVAFPTETVYGLGADALNPDAVARIFAAKERPADNPLIAHIADTAVLDTLVTGVDATARRLMDAFWPGPLTLVLGRRDTVPPAVSAGLPTLSVRMPSHPVALALIREAGCPVAAPSANRSGRPSPTLAAHVLEDMRGRIPLILDGGACGFGVESTVLDLTGDAPTVLRPGGVTVEMLRPYLPGMRVDDAVLSPLADGALARSPGMKHRHYAPSGRVLIVRGGDEAVAERIRALYDAAAVRGERALILTLERDAARYGQRNIRRMGDGADSFAASLYDALRQADAQGAGLILSGAADTRGIGLALMNRLLRAADFDVVDV